MNTFVLFQQMLMLFAMIAAGYAAFRAGVFDSTGQHQISKIIVNVLNPCLILSAIAGDRAPGAMQLSFQNFMASSVFYIYFIIASFIYYFIKRKLVKKEKPELRLEQLMIILSNLGFFGIPVVKALFGDEYVIYLIFYMLLFNIVAYTLGIYLALPHGSGSPKFSPKQIINTGTVMSIIAILLYIAEVPINETVGNFFTYMGNACIPLSMLLIGGSFAQLDLKEVFSDKDIYIFILLRNILIPALGILLFRMLPFEPVIINICCLCASMPIAALSGMISEQYAHKGNFANKMVAMSTVLSVVTVPLLSLLYL